jgi:hypothetical protein
MQHRLLIYATFYFVKRQEAAMARSPKNVRVTTKSRAADDEPEDVDNAAEEAEEAADDARFERMLAQAEADDEAKDAENDRRLRTAARVALPIDDEDVPVYRRGGPVKAAVRAVGKAASVVGKAARAGVAVGRASKPSVIAVVKPANPYHKGSATGHPSRGAYSK